MDILFHSTIFQFRWLSEGMDDKEFDCHFVRMFAVFVHMLIRPNFFLYLGHHVARVEVQEPVFRRRYRHCLKVGRFAENPVIDQLICGGTSTAYPSFDFD